jgi:uncharacterized membrane protein YeaQ/YmgE (transglycosylase-associated protein family)
MSSTIINLIIQLIAGAIGGNGAAASMEQADLGRAGNTIAGALGGIGGGQILGAPRLGRQRPASIGKSS